MHLPLPLEHNAFGINAGQDEVTPLSLQNQI